jgi:succinate-semialdehyde dehydrogenase/glutarate-semialdehyde dehydrogenase
MSLVSVNPVSGQKIAEYQEMSKEEVSHIILKTSICQKEWKHTSFSERSKKMMILASILRSRKEELAKMALLEMGKLFGQGTAEIEKCAWVCEYYAMNAEKFLQTEEIPSDAAKSFVTYQPLGVILAIMPWNFPFWQVFRCIVPLLMAGNACVLKHASNVQGCALIIEDVIKSAGFPEDVFHTLTIGNAMVNEIIENPAIAGVALTGSANAGKSVAAKAGSCLKKCVLELGGSDAYVVLEDADIELAVTTCLNSRLINSGQSCIAAKRFIVVSKVKSEFEKRLIDLMSQVQMGDPMDPAVKLGPLAREDLRDELHKQVLATIDNGASCVLGGKIPEIGGWFYPPTLLTNVKKGMPAYEEELFGPVAVIIEAGDQKEALEIANDTSFGLGGAVFTSNAAAGEEIAEKIIEAGCVAVNSFVKSDPRLPFGGIKESGFGRELSVQGIREFVNCKTVYIA